MSLKVGDKVKYVGTLLKIRYGTIVYANPAPTYYRVEWEDGSVRSHTIPFIAPICTSPISPIFKQRSVGEPIV